MNQQEKRFIQDKYEIVSKIKQGGFGIVYYGYDHVFDKPIAIKAIEPGLLKEAKYIDLFLEEAKNAGKLSHNNIVHIFNLVRDENGQFFIIMEYINGIDLGRVLRACRKKNILIPHELSIFIIKEICKALEYAHNKRDVITDRPLKLVHQDISPSNIMTSFSGQVKLIDFGLAKIRFQTNNSDQVILSGKLPYMAPEQFNGGTIDRRTDIFSLGSVFYEILTGIRLFPLNDPEQTIDLIKKGRIDTSLLDEKNVPPSVQQILLKMLQRDPENRYHGANGVYLDLVECLMMTAHSVELSEELGDFTRKLINYDSANTEQPAYVSTIEPAEDAEEPYVEKKQELIPEEPPVEEKQEFIPEQQISEPSGFGEVPLLEDLEQEISNSTGDSQELLLEHDATLNKLELVESNDLLNLNIETIEKQTSSEEEATSSSSQPELLDHDLRDSEAEHVIEEPAGSDIKLKDQVTVVNDENLVASPIIPSIYGEEEGEDDLKTVIDVIRLSTKQHEKLFKISGLCVTGTFILFLLFDIILQITALGEGIYNRLFPPAIRVASFPPGATLHLDGKAISGKTPVSIPKISPGVHELMLSHSGFSPLVKSVRVPTKGEIKVAGEKARKGYDPYVFRFKSHIELDSDPRGATVYINQVVYPQKTPTTIEWEAGLPLSLEMEHDGFQKLSGFMLNTLEGIEEIEDRRVWTLDVIEEEPQRYHIEGKFKKFITVSSIPSGVTFYIDGSSTPVGRTDISNSIALAMGNHELLFKKDGFNSKKITLNIDRNSPESISIILTRNVRFFAIDKSDPGNNEIGATIVKIIQNNKSFPRNDKTPCEISLPPVDLQIIVNKNGYQDAMVNVSPRDVDVVVKMETSSVNVEIEVKDALTGLPLKDAQISYRSLQNERSPEVYFGATDENGRYGNKIATGEYSFKVKKFGYFEKYTILNTKTGDNKLEFKLIIQ